MLKQQYAWGPKLLHMIENKFSKNANCNGTADPVHVMMTSRESKGIAPLILTYWH